MLFNNLIFHIETNKTNILIKRKNLVVLIQSFYLYYFK